MSEKKSIVALAKEPTIQESVTKVFELMGGVSSLVEKGSTVSVWFSTGPQTVSVPDVANKSQEEAKSVLESASFKVGSVKTVDSGTVEKDKVVSTDPAANSKHIKTDKTCKKRRD